MDTYLGIDTGGSKGHALVIDANGRVLALVEGCGGNPDLIGYDDFIDILKPLITEALTQAGIQVGALAGAGFGISGLDWDSQVPEAEAAIRRLGLSAPFTVVNDMLLGLYAGTREGWGIVVGAGTSCNCRGRDAAGREGRMVGYGSRFGEAAGAEELVEQAVRAVALQWTHRGEPTSLTRVFMQFTGVGSVEELLQGLALGKIIIPPSAAQIVVDEARKGDMVAGRLMKWAGQELASMVIGVARQLNFSRRTFEVVAMGSLFRAGELLLRPLELTLLTDFPLARLLLLKTSPVAGAGLLGMQAAGVDYRRVREIVVAEAVVQEE